MLIEEIMCAGPVIPVLKVNKPEMAIELAKALVEGGLPVLEVTLRTDNALEVIEAMSEVEGSIVGVGTITNPRQFAEAKKAGAQFAVTPGLSRGLYEAIPEAGMPVLPGVMTPSELIAAVEMGFNHLKLFPAEVAGGVSMLKALSGPFADVRFCPTGGVSVHNMSSYLGLANVLCVGGSWLAPNELLESGNWRAISQLAIKAVDIAKLGGWQTPNSIASIAGDS